MINAAIVGLGWWGKTLVESAQNSEAIRFVAGATRTLSDDVNSFAQQHRFRLAASYEALLADPGIDAVVLATPHSLHAAQVIAAAKAGKHVLCEKPFTLAKQEAEDAVAATKRAGIVLGVGYNRRFHPEMAKLRDGIHAGELGTIEHIEVTMTSPNVLFLSPSHWRADRKETPCGGLTPMGVHALDAMIDLCGEIGEVYCQSFRRAVAIDADDTTSVLLRMKAGMSGYLGTITATGASFSFQVFGSRGFVRLEGVPHIAGASSEERRTRLFGACRFQPVKGEAKLWQAETCDISRLLLEAFAHAIAGGPPFPISPDQIVHGVAVTEAIVRSAAAGRPQKVA